MPAARSAAARHERLQSPDAGGVPSLNLQPKLLGLPCFAAGPHPLAESSGQ